MTSDGAFIVSGTFDGEVTLGFGTPGVTTLEAPVSSFIAKYTPTGEILWVSGIEEGYHADLSPSPDGGFCVMRSFQENFFWTHAQPIATWRPA